MFYKYRTLNDFKFFVDIILNGRLYASTYENLNDPMEGVYNYSRGIPQDFIDRIYSSKQELRILSLSMNNNIPLMWSHYANGHRGVVIGIEIDENKYKVKPIKYMLDTFNLKNGWFPDPVEDIARNILSVKNKVWEYEEEARVFIQGKNPFINVKILQVITGRKMSDEDFKMITKLINKVDDSIDVMKAIDIFPEM